MLIPFVYVNMCFEISQIQESRPSLISSIESCVYTFMWSTAAACPLNSTQHDDCRVTNPATGQTPVLYKRTCFIIWLSGESQNKNVLV